LVLGVPPGSPVACSVWVAADVIGVLSAVMNGEGTPVAGCAWCAGAELPLIKYIGRVCSGAARVHPAGRAARLCHGVAGDPVHRALLSRSVRRCSLAFASVLRLLCLWCWRPAKRIMEFTDACRALRLVRCVLGTRYPVRWRGQDGLWSGRTARLERAFSLRKGPVVAEIAGPLCVMRSGRQRGQRGSLSGGPVAEQPAGRTPGRHEHGRPARVARGVRWPGVAKRCQHIVGVGVGYFPTAATNGFYRYTRSRTPWVQVGHHRRTRKAPGNWRQARRRKRERTGTCAVRPGRLRLYGPS
jgi:hypothetical protein